MTTKPTRGGARKGAGAPRKLEAAKSRTMRLVDKDWAKFKLLGGVTWLKAVLNERGDI